MSMDIVNELRSAATTLRTPTGCVLPTQDRITAELLDRAADALSAEPVVAMESMGKRKLIELQGDGFIVNGVAIFNPGTGRRGLVDYLGYVGWQAPAPVTETRGIDLEQFRPAVAQYKLHALSRRDERVRGVDWGQRIKEADRLLALIDASPRGSDTPPPPAPRWADAPAWARFVAMDADGQWMWFENRPYPETELGSDEFTLWDADDGRIQPISSGLRFDGWENSLQERPEVQP